MRAMFALEGNFALAESPVENIGAILRCIRQLDTANGPFLSSTRKSLYGAMAIVKVFRKMGRGKEKRECC